MAINDTESQDLLGDRPEQRPGYGTTDSLVQEPREPARYMRVLGVFLVVLAGFAFTAANVIQKIICPELNFWSLFLIRSLTQIPIMAAWTFWTQTPWLGPREIRCKIFMQGFFGGLLLLAIFVAVKHVPLGNASAIFFCTPVSTLVQDLFSSGSFIRLNISSKFSFLGVHFLVCHMYSRRIPQAVQRIGDDFVVDWSGCHYETFVFRIHT